MGTRNGPIPREENHNMSCPARSLLRCKNIEMADKLRYPMPTGGASRFAALVPKAEIRKSRKFLAVQKSASNGGLIARSYSSKNSRAKVVNLVWVAKNEAADFSAALKSSSKRMGF